MLPAATLSLSFFCRLLFVSFPHLSSPSLHDRITRAAFDSMRLNRANQYDAQAKKIANRSAEYPNGDPYLAMAATRIAPHRLYRAIEKPHRDHSNPRISMPDPVVRYT